MKAIFLPVFFCAIAVCVLAACSATGPSIPPPPSIQSPPAYPGAQRVPITPTTSYKDIPEKQNAFSTTDKPETIINFYRDTLLKEGWELSKTADKSDPMILSFVWPQRGCPVYDFEVVLSQTEGGRVTVVELRPQRDLCL